MGEREKYKTYFLLFVVIDKNITKEEAQTEKVLEGRCQVHGWVLIKGSSHGTDELLAQE